VCRRCGLPGRRCNIGEKNAQQALACGKVARRWHTNGVLAALLQWRSVSHIRWQNAEISQQSAKMLMRQDVKQQCPAFLKWRMESESLRAMKQLGKRTLKVMLQNEFRAFIRWQAVCATKRAAATIARRSLQLMRQGDLAWAYHKWQSQLQPKPITMMSQNTITKDPKHYGDPKMVMQFSLNMLTSAAVDWNIGSGSTRGLKLLASENRDKALHARLEPSVAGEFDVTEADYTQAESNDSSTRRMQSNFVEKSGGIQQHAAMLRSRRTSIQVLSQSGPQSLYREN